ncbi:MAG TPA: DUF58 domain-containing protein [Jiangellaceae bacterium]|nr:DUF58 domain-containing protein [Jiangellaceae bacterium]
MRRALSGLTRRGRLFLAVGLVAAVAAVGFGQRDLLRVAILLLALPVVSLLVALRSRVRLAAARVVEPPRTPVGTPARVRLILENLARIPTGVLLVEDTLPFALGSRPRFVLDHVWSRFRREVSYDVRADLRGRYPIGPLTVRLTDPFGLVELRRAFSETATVIITPKVVPLPSVRLLGEWSGSGESRPRSVASAGEEDATVRAYRDGDDMRRVNWRATAHHGELMVRREEQPWQSRATLLLDTRTTAHAGSDPDSSLEYAVSATASIGVHLATRGYAVRLVTDEGGAVSGAWHDSGGGPAGAEVPLLDALAVVQSSREASVGQWPDLLSGAGAASGLLVAVLGRLHPREASLVGRLRHGATGAIAILLDAASWTSVLPHVQAAEEQRLAETAQVLRRAGWAIVTAARSDALPAIWERLGVSRSSSRLATTTARGTRDLGGVA